MIRSQITLAAILFSVMMAACGGPTPNSNTTVANAPANAPKANSNSPLETTKAPKEQTVNDAPTLAPVFKAYCAAIKAKDETAIRKVYSQSTLKLFADQMKAEKIPTLLKFLENDKVDKICEIRNEQITGDRGTAEIKADWCPNGMKAVFVKENGEWKLTNESPDVNLKKPAAETNSAK